MLIHSMETNKKVQNLKKVEKTEDNFQRVFNKFDKLLTENFGRNYATIMENLWENLLKICCETF